MRLQLGDDRAVSEVLAFILVFSIVVTSVGLLYTVGFGTLDQIQENEQDRSADRAFSAVAVALEDIQTDRASNRRASVELLGRTVSVNDSESVEVEVDGNRAAEASGALVYGAHEQTEVAYHSGAVLLRQGEEQQVASRAPRFRCTDDVAVISLVDVVPMENSSFSSDGSVEILAEQRQPDAGKIVYSDEGSPDPVNVTYTGDRYETAWHDYAESNRNGWELESGKLRCEPDEAVYVRKTTIAVNFIRG